MHIVLTHVSPTDRRERIYAGWVAFIDEATITIINDGEYKAFKAAELLSIMTVMTGEDISLEDLRLYLSHLK
jgi:hypothetical protein